ncbi:8-oxo-dGTP pyrophosphatase MutT (NUDIX family) [Anaerotaenia torta]|uniref:NUDIX hydrolase n=1 Tax=Anaerotaenia torta TaxID=433293 RepID=UPI003D241F9B
MKEENVKLLQQYKGNYIKEMRKSVGHAPLCCSAVGVIIENEKGEILLQQRKDNLKWGLIGGGMEIGEKFVETISREAYEEAGIKVKDLKLFGIYSGEDRVIEYPNDDICCVTSIIFITSSYDGTILHNTEEAHKHKFFSKDNLPENINEFDKRYLKDWKNFNGNVIID